MAINPKVTDFVRREIAKNYDTPTAELQKAAVKLDSSLKRRSIQSFFASYVGPARKAQNKKKRLSGSTRPTASPSAESSPELTMNRMPENAPVASPPVHVPAKQASVNRGATPEDMLRRVLIEVAQDAMRTESRAEFLDLLARIDTKARDLAGVVGGGGRD